MNQRFHAVALLLGMLAAPSMGCRAVLGIHDLNDLDPEAGDESTGGDASALETGAADRTQEQDAEVDVSAQESAADSAGLDRTVTGDAADRGDAPVGTDSTAADSSADHDATAVYDAGVPPDSGTDGASCTNACASGSRCASGGVETCQVQANGCTRWVATKTCGPHQMCTATGSTASCACKATCTPQGTSCQDAQTVATCSQDADGCLYVASTSPCLAPMSCSGLPPTADGLYSWRRDDRTARGRCCGDLGCRADQPVRHRYG